MRNLLIALVVGALLGAITTYRLMPTKTLTQTQEKVVDRDVIKTITKVVKEPGGTVTITKESTQVSEKKTDKVSSHVSTPSKAVSHYRGTALFTPTFEPYAVGAEMRVVGPIWAGAQANKDRELLFTLSWEF